MPSEDRADYWHELVATLADPSREAERAKTTLFLRNAQRLGFEQLRKALEDPSNEKVTWRHPILRIRFAYDWSPDQEAVQDPEIQEAVHHLSLLTAGALIHVREGRSYTGLPISLLDGILRVPPDRQRELLEEWMDFEEWLQPVSYADPFDRATGIGRPSIFARGTRTSGQAALLYEIGPCTLDEDNKEAYFEITIGLLWTGAPSPELWTQPEREALWDTVRKLFDSLILASEEGSQPPDRVSTQVQGDSPTGFTDFRASLQRPEGHSIAKSASLKEIGSTALRRFPDYVLGSRGPVLEVLEDDGSLSQVASYLIYATMVFPLAPRKRQQYFVATCLHKLMAHFPALTEDLHVDEGRDHLVVSDVLYHLSPLLEINERLLNELVLAPPYASLLSEAGALVSDGRDAGEMLLFILNAAEQCPEHASENKAAYVRARELESRASRGRSVEIRRRSRLLKSWKRFRSTAHMWAAFKLSSLSSLDFSPDHPLDESFLAVSESLRLRAESVFARATARKHGPIQDPTSTWRVPEALALPEVDLCIPEFPERTLRWLAEYSPPGRRKSK